VGDVGDVGDNKMRKSTVTFGKVIAAARDKAGLTHGISFIMPLGEFLPISAGKLTSMRRSLPFKPCEKNLRVRFDLVKSR
jgi:hypothetical protein